MFLRHYSRIAGYASTHIKGSPSDSNQGEDDPTLEHFTGRLQDIANLGSLPQRITIESLASQLALPMDSEVAEVFRKNQAQSEIFRPVRLESGCVAESHGELALGQPFVYAIIQHYTRQRA